MVLESSESSGKRGRGRPRKQPVEEKKSLVFSEEKRGRGRPRKDTSTVNMSTIHSHSMGKILAKKSHEKNIDEQLSREDDIAQFESRSSRSGFLTLLMLVVSIGLIGYGMYVRMKTTDTAGSTQSVISQNVQNQGVVVEPTLPATNQGTDLVEQLPEDTQPEAQEQEQVAPAGNVIETYFYHVANSEFASLPALQDFTFQSNATLRNYFNEGRLRTFVNNLTGYIRIENIQEVLDDPVIARNPALNTKVYNFEMVYTLASTNETYRDARRGYTIERDGRRIINGLLYVGESVANSPFFQFNRFEIR